MRKICILLVFAMFIGLLPVCATAAAPADWAWLLDQVARGTASITLPNDIAYDGGEGLSSEEIIRIEGGGFGITGAVIDGGTFVFKDVRLLGTHGVREESGGDALVLRGDGAIAILMGSTRAEGGRSGPSGESGGDAIQLLGEKQGVVLNGTATAVGGTGRLFGGAGIRVSGCNGNVLLTDSASVSGSMGLAEGGSGIHAPACCKITLEAQSSLTGGSAQNAGGHGLLSQPCEACEVQAPISLFGMSMAIGSLGQEGGHGISITRTALGEEDDLLLADTCMIIGGDGQTNGSAIYGEFVSIAVSGQPQAFAGRYYTTEEPALRLTDSAITADAEGLVVTKATEAKSYPASEIPSMINAALAQKSEHYAAIVIEDGLAVQATDTKLNGFTVENGRVSQVSVNGSGLKIFMHNGTLEGRMQFRQRLMAEDAEATRLVLIGATSDEWPTLESTTAALRKLQSLGFSQLAYTCIAPTYNERILDLAALIEAIDAYEAENELELSKLYCGTADDAIIFVLKDGTRDYQEGLMPEVRRPAEEF